MPDSHEHKMFLPPDATMMDFISASVSEAMAALANRLESMEKRGLDPGDGFTMIALSEVEVVALAQLLQNTKLPKELYDLRKLMKPANFITVRRGGQG